MSKTAWIAKCIAASYPIGQRLKAADAAKEYLAWLDTLPCTTDKEDS